MRNYNPTKTPAENNRLTLADQAASGATAAGYQWPATQEEVIARALSNANQMAQGGGTGINPAVQDALDGKIDKSEKGEAGGVAPLDGDGLVPVNTLPEYLAQIAEDGADGIASILNAAGNRIGGLVQEEPPQMGPGAPEQFLVFSGNDSFFFYQTAENYRATIGAAAADLSNAAAQAALQAYVDPVAAARSAGWDAWLFDGITANQRVYWQTPAAAVIGTSDFTVVLPIRVLALRSGQTNGLWMLSTVANGSGYAPGAIGFTVCIDSVDALRIRIGDDTDYRQYSVPAASFWTLYQGQTGDLVIRRTAGVISANWVRGTTVTAITLPAETTLGTAPAWSSAIPNASFVIGSLFNGANYSGELGDPQILNRAWLAADMAYWAQHRRVPPTDRLGGSMTPIISSSFAADPVSAGWVLDTGATWDSTSEEVDLVSGAQCYLRTPVVAGLVPGRRYAVRYTVANYVSGLIVIRNGAGLAFANVTGDAIAAGNGVKVAYFTCNLAGSRVLIGAAGGGINASITDVDVWPIGALIQPIDTGTSQAGDAGPNRLPGQATAGVRRMSSVEDLGWVEYVLTTSGAFVTIGSGNPLVYGPAMIDRAYARADTAGADITLRNNSSSTNDIVTAATDLPTANIWVPLTIIDAQRALAANATLWGSASAGTIRVRVKLSRTN